MDDFHLGKMRRAKALAVECSQRLRPAAADALSRARLVRTNGVVKLIFGGERSKPDPSFWFSDKWIEGGSVEQLAEALMSLPLDQNSDDQTLKQA